jgi:ABC-type multidrug transport system fused ATPase/permease subunit
MKARIRRSRLVRVMSLMGRRISPYLLGITISGLAIAFCFNLVLGFVFKDVLNASLAGDSSLLLRGAILALGTFIFGMPVFILASYVVAREVCRTMTFVRVALFSKVTGLPMARVEERHSGDLISRATNDVQTLWSMLFDTMPGFAGAVSMGVIGLSAIFVLEWRLGCVVLAVGATSFGTSTWFARVLRKRSDALQASMAKMTERLSDLVAGISVARMFQLEGAIHGQYSNASGETAQRTIAHARSQAAFEATQGLLKWIQQFGTLALGLMLFSRGYLLVGAVWAIVHLQNNASWLFSSIGQLITGVQRGLAGGQRVLETLDLSDESSHVGASPSQPTSVEASLSLRDVSFSYAGQDDEFVLEDLSLSVKPGAVVALVGPSGGGKSTLLKLLLGFYLPQKGGLEIGGIPITERSLQLLRDQTAYVPQNAYLFSGTIEENISYGRVGASHEQIVAAATAAQAHDFVLQQPDGYETEVGEQGARLSGGQRQRIAIARALLKDAPILLLDEATSALDSESEQQVQEALDVLMKGRTTVAIAHRLSTIEHADRIFVLDEGRIVEQGCHQELLAEGGLYRQLYELQFPE